jgi:ketosteroid isomerase-like protein
MIVQSLPVLADDVADIQAAMAKLDRAFEQQDAAAILSMMTPDHVAASFTYGGPIDAQEQIALLPELKVTFSDMTEPKIDVLGSDATLVTYEVSLTGTFRGKPLPGRVFVSEIWVKTTGKWLEKTYQETVIPNR